MHVSCDGELTTFQDSLFHIGAALVREQFPELAFFLGPRSEWLEKEGGGHVAGEGALNTHGPQSLHLMSSGSR